MRIAALVIACVVFAALLVVDTGALLHLVFAWAMGGPAYRWALLCAPIVVALYIWGPKCHRLWDGFLLVALAHYGGLWQGAHESPCGRIVVGNRPWRKAGSDSLPVATPLARGAELST
jgi:hypothetical protein